MSRFGDRERMEAWTELPERAAPLRRTDGLATRVGGHETTTTPGRLDLPGTPAQAPPRWKTLIVTITGVYPISLFLQWLVTPHLPAWPLPVRAMVFPLIVVPLLTYVLTPCLNRALRRWLSPPRRGVSAPTSAAAQHADRRIRDSPKPPPYPGSG